MADKLISSVENNKDKQRTYRELMGRYNAAVRYGFYLEAMMIDYSMLEDRLSSFLYHLGVLPNRETLKISAKKTKQQITKIVNDYNGKEMVISLKNISHKIHVVEAILNWVNTTEDTCGDIYLEVLKTQCESLDIGGSLDTLSEIEQWIKYRNEIMHAALNKNIESLYSEMAERVEEGNRYGRFLDTQVRIVKRGNKIRKAANLVVEK